MQAISQLHSQLSDATSALESINLKVAQLQDDKQSLIKLKQEKFDEITRLDERSGEIVDNEHDTHLISEKEQYVASLEARLDLLQHQLDLVPFSFHRLANAFCEQSQVTTKMIENMLTEAIDKDFWKERIATTVAEIKMLQSRQTNMVKRLQLARQREEQCLREEAEEEESSLSMIESLLVCYEQKLHAMPDLPHPAPSQQPTKSVLSAVSSRAYLPLHAPVSIPIATTTHAYAKHNHPQSGSVHSHTVTIEEVLTIPAGVYPPTATNPPTSFHRHHYHGPTQHPPTHQPSLYPPTHPPTNGHDRPSHHPSSEYQLSNQQPHQPPYQPSHQPNHQPPQYDPTGHSQPAYHESHEERPWFQVLKRRRSVESTSFPSTSLLSTSLDLETAYDSASSSSSSSTPTSSVSTVPTVHQQQPRFRTGLDLLLESVEQ